MANPKFRYQHLKNSGNTTPSSSVLKDGEIAVGYLKGNEKLFIKNTQNEVVAFITSGAVSTMIENASTAITTDLSDLSGKVTTNTTNISTISGNVETISGNVTTNTTNISTISGNVTTISSTTIPAIENKITNLSGAVDSVSGVVDTKFGGVEYNSTAKTINFYKDSTKSGEPLGTIDATDFIKDGMVDNVEIKTITSGESQVTVLAVTFNSDSGKEEIDIPLTNIFDPSNYYTKSETSGATELSTAFNLKANQSDFESHSGDSNLHFSGVEKNNLDSLATNIATISGITSTDVANWNTFLSGVTINTTAATVANHVATITGIATSADLDAVSGVVNTHITNNDIHLTTNEKADVDAIHTNIATISSITASSAESWNNAAASAHSHANKTVLDGISAQDVTNWNTVSAKTDTSAFTAHTADTSIHVTTEDKTLWNGAVTSVTVNGTSVVNNHVATITDVASAQDLETLSGTVTAHTADTNIHLTATEKTNIDAISGNVSTLSAITASAAAINSLTGAVGTMAFQNASSYSSATEVNTALGGKQETLESGTNIRTITKNNYSLLGSGTQELNIVDLSDITVDANGNVVFDAGTY